MATISWDGDRTKTVSIASSGTVSDVLNMGSLGRFDAYRVGVLAPTALTGTITFEVSLDDTAANFRTLQSNEADVNVGPGKAAVLDPFPFRYLRIVSGSAEAAQRDFVVVAVSTRSA